METFDTKKLSEMELKAIAYDELARIEQAQLNLRIIKEELISRNANQCKEELGSIPPSP